MNDKLRGRVIPLNYSVGAVTNAIDLRFGLITISLVHNGDGFTRDVPASSKSLGAAMATAAK